MSNAPLTFAIRELTGNDFDRNDGVFETLANLSPSPVLAPADAKAALARMHVQGTRVFIAVQPDGTIVGTASLLVEQKLLRGGAVCGHIEDVVTRKGFERRGIGRALIEAILAKASELGCYKTILDSSEENVIFYEKFGFGRDSVCMRQPPKH